LPHPARTDLLEDFVDANAGAGFDRHEDTLLAASVEGMERDDLRVLAVLVTWLGIHHPWIN